MYCPKCGRVMAEERGSLTCVAGQMVLSRSVQEVLLAMFPTQEARGAPVELGFRPSRWFCPGCGEPLRAHECPRCGKSILAQRYQLVEFHPHRTEDGQWG